ncbi:MAG: SDR family NAD(P)-dependent oxidoreductase [Acidimicrobiia bacterium]
MTGTPTEELGTLVVTGAGRGLGASIAVAAAESGWQVGVLDVDEAAAAEVATTIGPAAVALRADTASEPDVEAALDRFADFTGRPAPDAFVADAGVVRFGPLLDLSVADWRQVVDVNLTGTFISARAAARRMIAADRPGTIVNVTSMNGVAPGPNAGAYGATKAGIALLTQQMALEWGPRGIRVNAVAPGLIDAGMSEPIYADPEIRARRSARVPLRRLGTAAEVADVVMFLLSDGARYINGVELLVDGGVTMSVLDSLPRPASVDSVGMTDDDATGAL